MLQIYNTLTGKKEVFEPVAPNRVKIYVCGPTVYDSCHIGHARSVIVFDVIVRYFRAIGYEVTYIRNFTDIDDKIINRANELGLSTKALSEKYMDEFSQDMKALKVEAPTAEPRATDYIPQIVGVIERLFDAGLAYEAGGDVFYSVERFKGYGKLSGRNLEDMLAGARIEPDEKKRNPFDFVLWKGAKPGEPSWESPWGSGRPGWHIECSAMSTHFLGETFDIHGGGKDLMFPHHENEIAQSEGAFGKKFAKFWVHNGFVQIDKEKMSKSLGNFFMIKDIVKEYHPEMLRLFLLSSHYRSPVDFSHRAIREAGIGLEKMYATLERLSQVVGPFDAADIQGHRGELWARFCEAMDDDFNTAQALGFLFDAVRKANRLMDDEIACRDSRRKKTLSVLRGDFLNAGQVLGIGTETPSAFFAQRKTAGLGRDEIDEGAIDDLVAQRVQARKDKDWARADQIRDQLADMNVILEDRPEGTVWKVKRP
jgi:cysteinyl-tRNA synthetase